MFYFSYVFIMSFISCYDIFILPRQRCNPILWCDSQGFLGVRGWPFVQVTIQEHNSQTPKSPSFCSHPLATFQFCPTSQLFWIGVWFRGREGGTEGFFGITSRFRVISEFQKSLLLCLVLFTVHNRTVYDSPGTFVMELVSFEMWTFANENKIICTMF